MEESHTSVHITEFEVVNTIPENLYVKSEIHDESGDELNNHKETVKEEPTGTFENVYTSRLNCSVNECTDEDSKDPLHISALPVHNDNEPIECNIADNVDIKIEIKEEDHKLYFSDCESNDVMQNVEKGRRARKSGKSQKEMEHGPPKKPRGRPKKVLTEEELAMKNMIKRPVGRPKNSEKKMFGFCQGQSNEKHPILNSSDTNSESHTPKKYVKFVELLHNGETLFQCVVCKTCFKRKDSINNHFKLHLKIYTCDICQKVFSRERYMENHMVLHTGIKLFTCDICGKDFSFRDSLLRHTKQHAQKSFECELCGKTFYRYHSLKMHIKGHVGIVGKYTCEICGKKFPFKTNLARHIETHSINKTYVCELCGKIFFQERRLRIHKKRHEIVDNRLFSCDTCENAFSTKYGLSKHVTIHSDKTFMRCTLCGKIIDEKTMLDHKNGHNSKLFVCDICRKTFAKKKYLSVHMVKHIVNKIYKCVCSKSFCRRSNIIKHMEVHLKSKEDNSDFYVCEICGKHYTSYSGLWMHSKTHNNVKAFNCTTCNKSFHSEGLLKKHYVVHTSVKSVSCDNCGKSFVRRHYLVRHLRRHDGVKPHVCTVCGNTFTESSKLKKHMVVHISIQGHACSECGALFSNKTCLTKHVMKNH